MRWSLVAVLAVGAALRVLLALRVQPPVELRDPGLYLILGDHLAAGDGYRYGFAADQGITAYYPPGYPLALGGVIWLVRLLVPGTVSAFDVAVWLNVVLSVATIGLVFVLGRRLVGPRVGLVAAGMWALWPNVIFHSGVVLTETLFLFLLVLLLVVLLADREAAAAPGVARLVTVGALFGLVLLVRPVSAVVAPFLLLLWWGRGARAALWRLGLLLAVTVAVLVPWSVRSTLAMDDPVLLSLNVGDNLCVGHSPNATGAFRDASDDCWDAEELPRPEKETRRNSENLDRALTYIREHPGTTLARTPSKLWYTLRDDWDGLHMAEDYGSQPILSSARREALHTLGTAYWAVAGLLAAGGAVVLLRGRDRVRSRFLVFGGLAQLISPLVTFGDPRFKMPLYPTVAVCAAVALVTLWNRWAPASRRTAAAPDGDGADERSGVGDDRPVAAPAATSA